MRPLLIGKGKNALLLGAEAAVLRAYQCRSKGAIGTIIRSGQDFSFTVTKPRPEPLAWVEKLDHLREISLGFCCLNDCAIRKAAPLKITLDCGIAFDSFRNNNSPVDSTCDRSV